MVYPSNKDIIRNKTDKFKAVIRKYSNMYNLDEPSCQEVIAAHEAIHELQTECPHDWELVTILTSVTRRCSICDLEDTCYDYSRDPKR